MGKEWSSDYLCCPDIWFSGEWQSFSHNAAANCLLLVCLKPCLPYQMRVAERVVLLFFQRGEFTITIKDEVKFPAFGEIAGASTPKDTGFFFFSLLLFFFLEKSSLWLWCPPCLLPSSFLRCAEGENTLLHVPSITYWKSSPPYPQQTQVAVHLTHAAPVVLWGGMQTVYPIPAVVRGFG